uniref:EGF-like domain-containing protein n=1 Tax=Timema monikensis TaxID=170555 RepID=A0A7R9E4A6_9NEOP|nr:unnamed protein product [Timema monikensis]
MLAALWYIPATTLRLIGRTPSARTWTSVILGSTTVTQMLCAPTLMAPTAASVAEVSSGTASSPVQRREWSGESWEKLNKQDDLLRWLHGLRRHSLSRLDCRGRGREVRILVGCYNNCINGYCVGAPDYSCKCDLGWTGVDCGLNCGCYNHSTCSQGVGLCDECENWTTGKFCQDCR